MRSNRTRAVFWSLGLVAAIACFGCDRTKRTVPEQATNSNAGAASAKEYLDQRLNQAAVDALAGRDGCVLVMDPRTARLRAVVNPAVAFEQAYPPGSTIKPFTGLAALKAGLIDPNTRLLCRGIYSGSGFRVICSHPRSKSPFDLADALAYSCDYYFARTAERLGTASLDATLSSFGFGRRTGIAANEAEGRLPATARDVRNSLGEGEQILVTPIQLLRAYVALVCGGRLMDPRHGERSNSNPQVRLRLSIPQDDREAIIKGMRGAVKFGTAADSGLESLPIGIFGKTGTSTASNGFRRQGWFVGFASPGQGQEPTLALVVFLKDSNGKECAKLAEGVFSEYARMAGGSGDSRASPEDTTSRASDPMASPDAIAAIPGTRDDVAQAALSPATNGTANGAQAARLVTVNFAGAKRRLGVEQYVLGVLRAESSVEDRLEALKAQAVISRSFAFKYSGTGRHAGFDFCSTTHCQRFSIATSRGSWDLLARRAVSETAGQVLRDSSGEIIEPYFHASCGGMTADIETLWGEPGLSYLRGVRDQYGKDEKHHSWRQEIEMDRLGRALATDPNSDPGGPLTDLKVIERDHTGRAARIEIDGVRRRMVRGWDFKIIVGRSLGWNFIKSSRFQVTRNGSTLVFTGSGFGHGLGLCQEGAHQMALHGFGYKQILEHYLPGTSLSSVPGTIIPARYSVAEGRTVPPFQAAVEAARAKAALRASRQAGQLSSEHFSAEFTSPSDAHGAAEVLSAFEDARKELWERLRSASLSVAESEKVRIILSDTTQAFMARTGQPWWSAGATKGPTICLQPVALLKRRGILVMTIRHELAHRAIDLLGRGKTPRWLAEGLAEHFAGEEGLLLKYRPTAEMDPDEIDRRLERAQSQTEMRMLYAAALAEVDRIIASEGEAAIWRRLAT